MATLREKIEMTAFAWLDQEDAHQFMELVDKFADEQYNIGFDKGIRFAEDQIPTVYIGDK